MIRLAIISSAFVALTPVVMAERSMSCELGVLRADLQMIMFPAFDVRQADTGEISVASYRTPSGTEEAVLYYHTTDSLRDEDRITTVVVTDYQDEGAGPPFILHIDWTLARLFQTRVEFDPNAPDRATAETSIYTIDRYECEVTS